MADLTFAPAAAAGIKPVPQTSLSDMLGMARGVQEYQQAQQINPLALQLKQLEAQRAAETTPSEIARTQSLGRQQATSEESANFALQQQYADKARGGMDALLVSPHFQPKDGKFDSDKMLHDVDAVERVLTAQGVKKHPNGVIDQLKSIIKEQPDYAATFLKNIAAGDISPESRLGLALPEAIAGGPGQPPTMRNKVTGALQAAPIVQQIPQAPQVGQVTAEGAPIAEGPKPSPKFMEGMYKTRPQGDLSPYGPSEKADESSGIAYRQKLLDEKQSLPQRKTNVDAVINQVNQIAKEATFPETGASGAIKRKFAELIGDPKYQALEKDLANLVLANESAAGGSTDAGRALRQASSGKVGLAPEVLIDIARRAKADMINLDLQSDAADKFGTKFGDNNQKSFRKNWNNNADTNIFRVMEIHDRLGKTPEAQAEVNKLIGGMSADSLVKFQQKYRNIRGLTEYGYIPEEKAK